MIEWMQTHRKWLVITIWVATIAFIGAGFVGWGQFDFNKSSSTVAKVKDTEVTIKDWQEAYTNLFDRVNKQLGGTLDEATAEKLGLKNQALQMAIEQAILRQYAKDLDLYVTDEDVAKKVLEYFKDKKTYLTYLKNTGQKAKDFEERLKKQLLIEKLLNFLHLKPEKTELLTIASALYNADKLEIKVINKNNLNVSLDEAEIKQYWEENKNKYLSPRKYKISYVTIPLAGEVSEEELKAYYEENKLNYKNDKGEILSFDEAKKQVKQDYLAHKLKKEAIIAYKKLKNSEGDYKLTTLTVNNNVIPISKMNELIKNGYLKPFVYNQNYITAKLIEEIKPTPLPYEQAKSLVMKDLLNKKSTEKLINLAKNELKNFKGKDIGFVTKYDFDKIKDLPSTLAEMFLFEVFTSQNPKSFVLLPKNNPQYAVLYNIKEQKLLDEKKYEQNKKLVYNLAETLINNELL
jgi:peptidyl-prolyl cis-trans isomerase D